jgi:hypothetical protein
MDRCRPVSKSPVEFLRHIPRVIRYGCIAIQARVIPDFMASRCLTVKHKAASSQLPNNLFVSKSCQSAHLRGNDNCVVTSAMRRRQIGAAVAFALGFNQSPCDIPCDLERLGNSSPLRDKSGQLI